MHNGLGVIGYPAYHYCLFLWLPVLTEVPFSFLQLSVFAFNEGKGFQCCSCTYICTETAEMKNALKITKKPKSHAIKFKKMKNNNLSLVSTTRQITKLLHFKMVKFANVCSIFLKNSKLFKCQIKTAKYYTKILPSVVIWVINVKCEGLTVQILWW